MKREGPWPAFDLVMGVLWTVVVIVRVWERAGLAVILLNGILALSISGPPCRLLKTAGPANN